jgi:hypothetical protein
MIQSGVTLARDFSWRQRIIERLHLCRIKLDAEPPFTLAS